MEDKVISLEERAKDEAKSYLEELFSEGVRKLLQRAVENEVTSIWKYTESDEPMQDSGRPYAMVTIRNANW